MDSIFELFLLMMHGQSVTLTLPIVRHVMHQVLRVVWSSVRSIGTSPHTACLWAARSVNCTQVSVLFEEHDPQD